MKYRKKPIVVDAFQYGVDESRPDWFWNAVTVLGITTYDHGCHIHTLEGVMLGRVGDYIIRGVAGEIYPCKPDIFEATYEQVKP